jgi:integrase
MTVFFNESRKRWQYEFQLGGVRHSRFCFNPDGTPCTSRRAAGDAEAEAKRQAKMAPKLPRATDLTLAQVINDLSEGWMLTPEWPNKRRVAKEILAFFGPEKAIRDMSAAECQDFIVDQLKKPIMIWHGGASRKPTDPDADKFWKQHATRKRTNATVNRALPPLRAIFQRAYDTRDPITRERAIDEIPVIKDLPEGKRKARPVPDHVITETQETLPAHVTEAMIATLYFGFRKTEAFSLQIHHVDFQAGGIRFKKNEVKNKEDSFLPGSRDAMQFLAMLVDQARERGAKHLITWRRFYKDPARQAAAPWKPIKSPKRAWGTVMKRIKARHDVRAAYITQIALKAGPVAAQRLARHSDFSTTQGYIDVADEVLRAAAETATQRPALGVVQGGKK